MTERAQVVVPVSGVRKDVADILQTPDMMRTGTNVMVYDGSVRPRPGVDRETTGGIITPWKMVYEDYRCAAAFNDILLVQLTDDSWEMSDDKGWTWVSAGTITGPAVVRKLKYLRNKNVLVAFDSLGDMWTADVTSYPTPSTITFTNVGDYRATIGPSAYMHATDPVFFDFVKDTLWWQAARNGGSTARICCLENASTITAGTFAANYSCGPKITPKTPITLCGNSVTDDNWAVTRAASSPGNWKYSFWLAGDIDTEFKWFTCTNYFYRVYPRTAGPAQAAYLLRGRDYSYSPITLNAFNTIDFNARRLVPSSDSHNFRLWDYINGVSALLIGSDNLRTTDGWTTYEQYADFPGIVNNLFDIHSFLVTDCYFVEATNMLGQNQLWFVNGQIGTGVQGDPSIGDCLTLFQASIDTDPSALFLGTTLRMLHYDIGTSTWSDLSPIDPAYSIDGDVDANRWVFRVTEKNGDKYVVATNGQIPPIAWESTLTEFRPVGDVDEDGLIGEGETGAPVATTMAIANNRLVLAKGLSVWISDPQDFDSGYGEEYKLADTYGDIVAMRELNAITIAILKTDAIYHGISQVEFMGVSAPMRFELIKKGIIGPCTDAAVVHLPDGRLCWLGRDGGVYVYDGTVPTDVGRHIRHMIYPLLNTDHFGYVHGVVDTQRNLLWFFFPSKRNFTGTSIQMNTGIVLSIDQGNAWPMWKVEYPYDFDVMSAINVYYETDRTYGDFGDATYADYAETAYNEFEGGEWKLFMVRANLAMYSMDWGKALDDETPIKVKMETGWYDFDDMYQFDQVQELHHNIEFAPGWGDTLTWTVYSEQSDNSELSQSDYLHPQTPRLRTSYRQTGRRHRFALDADVGYIFRWGGATVQFVRGGGR